jgi:hypothetical protein
MMLKSSIYDCCIIELNKVHNRSGNITVIEGNNDIPFGVERIYYLYDVPGGAERGGHAHKDLVLDDGKNRKVVELNRPYYGLYIVPGIWREIINFSSGAICLVLASHKYDKEDYIRDYNQFTVFKHENPSII